VTANKYIYSRALQKDVAASEGDLKDFLDRFVTSAREAFKYGADQFAYEAHVNGRLSRLGRCMIHE